MSQEQLTRHDVRDTAASRLREWHETTVVKADAAVACALARGLTWNWCLALPIELPGGLQASADEL